MNCVERYAASHTLRQSMETETTSKKQTKDTTRNAESFQDKSHEFFLMLLVLKSRQLYSTNNFTPQFSFLLEKYFGTNRLSV